MDVSDIVEYWARFGRDEATGQWTHPDDRAVLAGQHSFNLDYPTCPYLGPVTSAKVVILGANGGYSPTVTPDEFPDAEAFERYLRRIRDPESADWSNVSPYYDRVNYGPLVFHGDAVWINASPYRSLRISAEPDNHRLVRLLPSSAFIRRWLIDAVVPLAARGERLVVVKRPGLWRLPPEVRTAMGVIVDPAPISPQLTSGPWKAVQDFLTGRGPASGAHTPGPQETAGQTRTTAEPGEVEARRKRLKADAIPAGTPQSQVWPLVRVCEALGLKLIAPEAAWPGYGKVVHLDDERSIYINRTNADVRSSPAEIAAWQKAGLGTVRPDNDRYLRVKLDAALLEDVLVRGPESASLFKVDVNDMLRDLIGVQLTTISGRPNRILGVRPPDAGQGILGFDLADAPPVESLDPEAALVDALLGSATYREQRLHSGRHPLDDAVVRSFVLGALRRGGRAHHDTLAADAGVATPLVAGTLVRLRRLLNVDMYPVVRDDEDGVTLVLDVALLRQQFGLGS